MITLTASAITRVNEWLREEKADPRSKAFRVFVEPGSHAGYEVVYQLDRRHDDDRVFSSEGFDLVVDPWSYTYLRGATIDAGVDGFRLHVPASPWNLPAGENA